MVALSFKYSTKKTKTQKYCSRRKFYFLPNTKQQQTQNIFETKRKRWQRNTKFVEMLKSSEMSETEIIYDPASDIKDENDNNNQCIHRRNNHYRTKSLTVSIYQDNQHLLDV